MLNFKSGARFLFSLDSVDLVRTILYMDAEPLGQTDLRPLFIKFLAKAVWVWMISAWICVIGATVNDGARKGH